MLVIYCCITNYPKAQQLRTTNIYYLRDSEGKESGSGPGGFFWFWMSYDVQSSCRLGLPFSEGAGESASGLTPVSVTGLGSLLVVAGDFSSTGFPVGHLGVPML